MKKLLMLLIAALFVMGGMVGCGKPAEKPEEPEKPAEKPADKPAEKPAEKPG